MALLILSCLFGVASRGEAASGPAQHTPNSSPILNLYFAIADFDGDRKPDLATVEVQKASSSRNTQYSIRFQLTAGIPQVFGISAPAGGLQIVARDVNGDDALDLLVSTMWQHQQVAVLLNDGHGNFTLAEPGAYPASLWECEYQWKSGAIPVCDGAALVRSSFSAGDLQGEFQFDGLRQTGRANVPAFHGSARLLFFSLLGRAPPSFVH